MDCAQRCPKTCPRGFLQKKNLKFCGQNAKFCKLKKANFAKILRCFYTALFLSLQCKYCRRRPTKPFLFLIKCRSLVKQYNKSYGSRSVNFVNSVNSEFWLQSQSELMAAMNTGLKPYQAETDLINIVAYQFLNNDLVYICK